jgi:hypothetical protein
VLSRSNRRLVLTLLRQQPQAVGLERIMICRGQCPHRHKLLLPRVFRARRWSAGHRDSRLRLASSKIWKADYPRGSRPRLHLRGRKLPHRLMFPVRYPENQRKAPARHSNRLPNNSVNLVSGRPLASKEGRCLLVPLAKDFQRTKRNGWHLNPAGSPLSSASNSALAAPGRTASRSTLNRRRRRSRAHSPSCCLAANRRPQQRLGRNPKRKRAPSRPL